MSCSGYTECVKWLIANRAKLDVLDNNGRTPLDIAEVNHNSITRYSTGAEMNQAKKSNVSTNKTKAVHLKTMWLI